MKEHGKDKGKYCGSHKQNCDIQSDIDQNYPGGIQKILVAAKNIEKEYKDIYSSKKNATFVAESINF